MVGASRFERPTPCSQGRCANQAALRPVISPRAPGLTEGYREINAPVFEAAAARLAARIVLTIATGVNDRGGGPGRATGVEMRAARAPRERRPPSYALRNPASRGRRAAIARARWLTRSFSSARISANVPVAEEEDRIVAEAAVAAGGRGDEALADAFGDQLRVRRVARRPRRSGSAPVRRSVGTSREAVEQQRDVGRVAARRCRRPPRSAPSARPAGRRGHRRPGPSRRRSPRVRCAARPRAL